ncbi:MBL fold metallo-hydrolase [Candidatus Wolfebacteria bacterium]|nr:MBL fold metallo-hydrolase [Candidatus Wolfebacteria bacterium]
MEFESVKLKDTKNWIVLLAVFLIIFDGLVWHEIIFNAPNKNPEVYFLNVGQGDSEMVMLSNNVKILIDGGPANNKILENLSQILPRFDRRIDLVVMSHPQLDHFGGLIELFKRYDIGAFIWSGIENNTASFKELQKVIKENNIPEIILAEGDKIKYRGYDLEIIYPPKNLSGVKDLNDVALVLKFTSKNGTALFTADIGKNVENYLVKNFDLKSDILKVAHHGSKFSSTAEFLNEVLPKVSIIEVGKNSYGHPTKDVLARLADFGSKIFRTDKDGIIKLTLDNGQIKIFSQR